jgi:hypothetical protein
VSPGDSPLSPAASLMSIYSVGGAADDDEYDEHDGDDSSAGGYEYDDVNGVDNHQMPAERRRTRRSGKDKNFQTWLNEDAGAVRQQRIPYDEAD